MRIVHTLLACCALVLACRETDHGQAPEEPPPSTDRPVSFTLDRDHRIAVQPLGAMSGDAVQQKFVQVEVGEVVNPKLTSLIFQVRFRRVGGEEVELGSFALYPADNPGTFIVATRGLLEREGAIVVSMESPDGIDGQDPLRVELRAVTLRTN